MREIIASDKPKMTRLRKASSKGKQASDKLALEEMKIDLEELKNTT